jgi:cytochrome c
MMARSLYPAAGLALLAAGVAALSGAPDPDRGKALFEKRCIGCHAPDTDKEGPRLRGVFGRSAGAVATFEYSDAMKKSGITWDETTLNKWMADPDGLVPDNNMPFRVVSQEERSDIVAYLKTLR